jgi:hypothetical protein
MGLEFICIKEIHNNLANPEPKQREGAEAYQYGLYQRLA